MLSLVLLLVYKDSKRFSHSHFSLIYVSTNSLHFVMIFYDIINNFTITNRILVKIPSKIKVAFLLAPSKESYILSYCQEISTETYIFIMFFLNKLICIQIMWEYIKLSMEMSMAITIINYITTEQHVCVCHHVSILT